MASFWEDFESYIHSYLPQWQYDPASGETESALLRTAAELLLEERNRLDTLPGRHEREFLRLHQLTPLAAQPMQAYAMLYGTEDECIPAGTEFYLSGDGTRLWRTLQECHTESMQLSSQVLVGAAEGKLIPLPPPTAKNPTRLFDLRAAGSERREAQFFHPDAFASQRGCTVCLTMDSPSSLVDFLGSKTQVLWYLISKGEELLLPTPQVDGQSLHFTLPPQPDAQTLLVRVLPGCVPPPDALGKVAVHALRQDIPYTLAIREDETCQERELLPFGRIPTPWSTCHLGCSDALTLRGARMTISFALSTLPVEELLPGMEQPPVYKPVMRRLPSPPPTIRDVYPEQVIWEYWNGMAWRTVPETASYGNCFRLQESGIVSVELSFPWPKDASPCQVQGEDGLWLRWRLLRLEGDGWLPRRIHTPVVTGLHFTALLESDPVAVTVRNGLEPEFVPYTETHCPLFSPLGLDRDCWWLGFDHPPASDSLQLYLALRGQSSGGRLTAWEGLEGDTLRPLKLKDGTDGLRHEGFLTIQDIRGGLSHHFQQQHWWLCLKEESGSLAESGSWPQLTAAVSDIVPILADGTDRCEKGETLLPLRGGTVSGVSFTESFGGCPEEDDKALLRRARCSRHNLGRMVSYQDVSHFLCGRLRDIRRIHCVCDQQTVTVGVLMWDLSHHAAAFALRKPDILRLLEQYSALSMLGLEITVREPCFYPVNVTAWLRRKDSQSPATLYPILQEAFHTFLQPCSGHFHERGWQLGYLPTDAQLRGCLQLAASAVTLQKLLVTVTLPDGRELPCSQVRDPFALPVNGVHTIHLLGEEEAYV